MQSSDLFEHQFIERGQWEFQPPVSANWYSLQFHIMCYSHNPMASSDMGAMGPGVCVLACVPFHLIYKRNIRTGSASELRYYDCSSHYELEEFAGLTPKFSHMLQRGRLMYKVNRSD